MARTAELSITVNALRAERVRLTVMSAIVVLYSVASVLGYRTTYPTQAERDRIAAAFHDNPALRLFYGIPRDLASVGGYAEFRLVGLFSIVVATWAVFAAVRPLRAEEDAGRFELLLAGRVTRVGATGAVLAALVLDCVVLWAATSLTLLVVAAAPGDMTASAALLLGAAATFAPAVVFALAGAVVCQLAPTARSAHAAGGAVVAASFLLRMVADLVGGADRLRWLTPLGWAEEIHPVTGSNPWLLAPFAVTSAALGATALALCARRDVGSAVFGRRDGTRSRTFLLGSPLQAAVRRETPTFLAWALGAGVFAFVLGFFSKQVAEEARKAGLNAFGIGIESASDYLALAFVLFALVVSLFAVSHIGVIRNEESSGRLETLLALPVGRHVWLAGRIMLAVAATVALALAIGLIAWAGAAPQHAGVTLAGLLGAGANCVPAALLFLGLGSLLFAFVPRQSSGGALLLVGAAFLWDLVSTLTHAPSWLRSISPFHHLAAVPRDSINVESAVVMLLLALATMAVAVVAFGQRDLRTD